MLPTLRELSALPEVRAATAPRPEGAAEAKRLRGHVEESVIPRASDLDAPLSEVGVLRPVVVVTAQEILDESANVVQVVALTSTVRPFGSEVAIQADENNGLEADSAAQCQHVRSVSIERVESVRGNVGVVALTEIRDVLGLIFDIN